MDYFPNTFSKERGLANFYLWFQSWEWKANYGKQPNGPARIKPCAGTMHQFN